MGGCFAVILFISLAVSMATMGIFYWLDKTGISISFLTTKSDSDFIIIILLFLLIVAIAFIYSAKSEKMFRIAIWVLLGLAITNISGCMGMWDGFNGAFGI